MLFVYGILFFYIAYGMLLLRKDLSSGAPWSGWVWHLGWPYYIYKHF